MSTQQAPGIEFSIVPEGNQQHFRLLELPPDLLSVLTSDNPPVLQLKSPEGPPGHALESTASLCTPDKTYTLRQVSTSNEVYIAQPASVSPDNPSSPGLAAVAKCESTLEIQPAKNVSPIPYIKSALPTYTTTGHVGPKEPLTRSQLFSNIPLSDAECASAWQDLACFEDQDARSGVSRAVIPSNSTKLKVWQTILQASTAKDVDLTDGLSAEEMNNVLSAGGDLEWPIELVSAVLRSFAAPANPGEDDVDIRLEETKCASYVGEMVLREKTENGRIAVPIQTFKETWADLLPEKWRSRADLDALERCYDLENGGKMIKFLEPGAKDAVSAAGKAPAEAKSTLGAKRKWHDKFRASKKTA